MRSMRFAALAVSGLAVVAVSLAPSALAVKKAETSIKSTRLDDVNDLTGKGVYSGRIKSKNEKCVKRRKVTVIHLSTPPFTIGETETDQNGDWRLEGPVPPSDSPQRIKVVVDGTKKCKSAERRYDIDDIAE